MNHLIVLLLLAATGLSAFAQSPSSRAEVASTSSLRLNRGPTSLQALDGPIGDGREIQLLEEVDIFYFSAYARPQYQSNAFYDSRELGDYSFDQSFALGANTLIAERFYTRAELFTSIVRYDGFSELDREQAGVLLQSQYSLTDEIALSASYSSTWFFNDTYSNNDSTFHTVSIGPVWSTVLPGGALLQTAATYQRTWADPGDYDQSAWVGSFLVAVPLGATTEFGISGMIRYEQYDHYFSSVFDQSREDLFFAFGVHLSYRPWKNVEIRPEILFTTNNSSIAARNLFTGRREAIYDYDAWTFLPAVSVSIQF